VAANVPSVTPHVQNAATAIIGLGLIVLVFALISFIAASVASASNSTEVSGIVGVLKEFQSYLRTLGTFLLIFAIVTMAIGIISYLMSTFGISIRFGGA